MKSNLDSGTSNNKKKKKNYSLFIVNSLLAKTLKENRNATEKPLKSIIWSQVNVPKVVQRSINEELIKTQK